MFRTEDAQVDSSALSGMIINEIKLRRRYSIDWNTIDLPASIARLENREGRQTLRITDRYAGPPFPEATFLPSTRQSAFANGRRN